MQAVKNAPVVDENLIIRGSVQRTRSPQGLTDIYDSLNNLVIWQRAKNPEFLPELSAAVNGLLSQNRALQRLPLQLEEHVTPDSVRSFLKDQFKWYQDVDALIEDLADLVDMFCCLFEVEKVGLRLTMLDKAMCPKFHVDRVPCRLVTTYQGTATEWLSHHEVDRTKLGKGGHGLADHESGIYLKESDIQQLETFDVALLKGELWEGNEGAGIVHRSPAVAAGEQRLLLTLDFVS